MKLFLIVLFFICSCSTRQTIEKRKTEVQRKYFEAMRSFDEKNYSVSLRLFEEFTKENSLHTLAKNSLQMEILLNFVNEKYEMTTAVSDLYLQFYPIDKDGCQYAKYMKILAQSKTIKSDKVSYEDSLKLDVAIKNFNLMYPNGKYKTNTIKQLSKNDQFICRAGEMIAAQYESTNNLIASLKKYEEIYQYCNQNIKIKEKIEKIKKSLIN